MDDLVERAQAPLALRLLPPFPAIAHRILALASHEDSTAQEVGGLIKLDPSFSAELLRCANSALFGVRREVASLGQAVAILGMDRVKSMATFVAVNNMVRSSTGAAVLRQMWVHSVVTAMVMEEAARLCHLDRDSAYTIGLLHNLGALGLMSAYPEEYSRLLESSVAPGFDLLAAECHRFEIDHCSAGAHLAKRWQFPDHLQAAIATHHREPVPDRYAADDLIRLSWRLAGALGYAAFTSERTWIFDELLFLLPHSTGSWLCGPANAAKAHIDANLADSPL